MTKRLTIDAELEREARRAITRRHLLGRCMAGMGAVALSALLNEKTGAAPPAIGVSGMAPAVPRFAGWAKNVIYLHMVGAPSQLDLFDFKPKLIKYSGKDCPAEYLENEQFSFIRGVPKMLGTPYAFARHGQSGAELSSLLPHLASIVDEIAIVKSMHTDEFNHIPAQFFLSTGYHLDGRPAMGSWVTYGLGSPNSSLPGFVVLNSNGEGPPTGPAVWGSGFLPGLYQGTPFRTKGPPVLAASNPAGMSPEIRRRSLDALYDLNARHQSVHGDNEIGTRIEQFELAYRMQSSVPELMDIASEPPSVHAMYGTKPGQNTFANNCLLARRLVERGVRFVQLYDGGWDHHGTDKASDIYTGLAGKCADADRASVALVRDLKQRGLLDETLVVWGGEFGRTPMNEARDGSKFLGRDHHKHAFTLWLAGGGIRRGITIGATDDLGYLTVKDPVHVRDLHATILHSLGLDPARLTYRFQGKDFSLTDAAGEVVTKILA